MKQGRFCAVLVLTLTAVLLAPAAADVIGGKDIQKFFGKEDYKFTVKDDYSWWVLPYKGTGCGNFNVDVKYGRDYTYVMAYLFDVPKDCGRAFYWDLCRRNFELNQVKLSIDNDNRLWISYEIPNRILDFNELCCDIDTIACWYEDNYNDLKTAMNRWWGFDREAEFRPTYTSPGAYPNIEKEAVAHIEETSPGWESPRDSRNWDWDSNSVSGDVVSSHINETTPPREFIRPDYKPPAPRSAGYNADRMIKPKVVTMEKMPSLTSVSADNAVAKSNIGDEKVAGIKQKLTRSKRSRDSRFVDRQARISDPNRAFHKTANAVRSPGQQVAPYKPASISASSWHKVSSKLETRPPERVAGWTQRTMHTPGMNHIDRARSKMLSIYCYEDKLTID